MSESPQTEQGDATEFFDLQDQIWELIDSGKITNDSFLKKLTKRLENEELSIPDLKNIFADLKARADRAVSANIPHRTERVFKDQMEMVFEQEWAVILEKIRKSIEGVKDMVGSGNVAEVYPEIKVPRICYKIVKNYIEYSLGNNLDEEAQFLADLSAWNVQGVRVSKPFYSIMERGLHVLAMEKLDAVSWEDVFERKAKLPKTFQPETFFVDLQAFLDKMHAAGIHHHDLHEGNVMIDLKTGKPRIIDFGLALRHTDADPVQLQERLKKRGEDDDKMLVKLQQKVKKYLQAKRILTNR